jgi:hypothetical protein
MTRKPQPRKSKAPPQSELVNNTGMTVISHPVFGQPLPTADPILPMIRLTNASTS